jgi:hypothetical protein
MAAYADQVPGNPPIWQLRQREELEVREQDLREIFDILRQLAGRLDTNIRAVKMWCTGLPAPKRRVQFFPGADRVREPLLHLFSRTPGPKIHYYPRKPLHLVLVPTQAGPQPAAALRRNLALCQIPPDSQFKSGRAGHS